MKRRSFIKKAGVATAGAFAAPYILPSGKLFAATGSRIANHVVLCIFAGGVRNFETIQKAEGNLMPFTLTGNENINPQIADGMDMLPIYSGKTLQQCGTLFKEFRYKQGPTGHFSAHAAILTGQYNLDDINLKQRPSYPTLFEYYRKHQSSSFLNDLNAWWISNTLGPYPTLSFSNHDGYGEYFGANFIQPHAGMNNTIPGDTNTMLFAGQIIKEHKPELTVVNMLDADVCHANFTAYCNNIRRADYALWNLWQTIQSTPGMADDTILIALPDHGRNEEPNTIIDKNGKYAIDHTGDEISRQIFCLIAGPEDKVVQNQEISSVAGESIDIVPTIAKILGFQNDISSGMLPGRYLEQAFVSFS